MKYYADFEIGNVDTTRARTITEADIVNFAAFSGDWYPLHTDVEYAKKGPFGERIAHGMLVLSVAVRLLWLQMLQTLQSETCHRQAGPVAIVALTRYS